MFWFLMIGGAGFVIGWFIRLFSRARIKESKKNSRKNQVLFTFCLVASMLLVVFLSMYYSWSDDYEPQGRYLIPAFSAAMLLVTAGWRWITEFTGFLIHSRVIFSRFISAAICIGMAALQFNALFSIVLPNFQGQPRLPENYANESWLHRE